MSDPARCHRCDVGIAGLRHRCRHRNWCVDFDRDDHCRACRRFKEKQIPLFDKTMPEIQAKPFLKWAGGKRQLVPQLMKHIPEYSGRYFEPFVGGGAMFFALMPERAVLADINQRLVRTYRGVASDVEMVIYGLGSYPFDKHFFLQLRSKPIDDTPSDIEVACWLIYLNKTAFNGLYRVNKRGIFNVPWGKYKNPTICDETTLRACSIVLRRAELICDDFENVVKQANESDLVYFDPPYAPTSETSNFTSYTKGKFGLNDQIRLRDCALKLKERGVHVMITNSNTKIVRELYADGFEIQRLSARGSVAANKKSRGKRTDLLIM